MSHPAEPVSTQPRNAGGKSAPEVREMFSRVARRYDFLNHFLSLGLDIHWRNVAAREAVGLGRADSIADLCTGTGDLAFALNRKAPDARIVALDFTPEMVAYGPKKAAQKRVERITFGVGDTLNLPLRSESVALASVAFGIRNVADLKRGLSEMVRVVRPGGKVVVLEFTKPTGYIFGPLYMFYFRHILPLFGRMIAATAGDAYRYLPQSVQAFAGPEEMSSHLRELGLVNIRAVSLTFGTVHLYVGEKPAKA
ncbi:MAG TPA: ubiquinone/menaquinone biosynthesis methyltransferase [Planctomycetota bacterium]|nr:ubiquinone/menaquinone biosynthesis methyltransferase [Planctomycetota bacterium]